MRKYSCVSALAVSSSLSSFARLLLRPAFPDEQSTLHDTTRLIYMERRKSVNAIH